MGEIIIVGAGISGLVFAEQLSKETKKQIIIVEKRNHIGGNCYDFINKVGIRCPLYGPHFFHTNNAEIFKYVSKFTDWIPYEHKVLTYVNNKYVPIPINITTINSLFKQNIKNQYEMKKWLKKELVKTKSPKNSEDLALSTIGKKLYEIMFKNYTIKQWGKHPRLLDASIIKRIPIRYDFEDRYFTDKYQYMPKEGYEYLFKNMINSKNIKIMFNTDYFKYDNRIIKKAEKIIYTGPIDRFYKYKFGQLEYRSLKFKHKNLDQQYFQPVTQINYPNNYKYTRITEPKHCYSYNSKKTTVIKEYPTSRGEPYYPIINEQNNQLYNKYISIKKKKVIFAGRLANYKYLNMDQAFKNALSICQNTVLNKI